MPEFKTLDEEWYRMSDQERAHTTWTDHFRARQGALMEATLPHPPKKTSCSEMMAEFARSYGLRPGDGRYEPQAAFFERKGVCRPG